MQQELRDRSPRDSAGAEGEAESSPGGQPMWLVTFAALFAAALGRGRDVATTVLERRSEIGIWMKALGASRRASPIFSCRATALR